MSTFETWIYWLSLFGLGFSLAQASSHFRKQQNYGAMWSVYAVTFASLAFVAWMPDVT